MISHIDQELNIDGLQEYFDELSHDCDCDDFHQMRANVEQDLYVQPREWFSEWLDNDEEEIDDD